MIEKIIENWLTNTTERGYMPAYCQLLIHQGYKLLYVSTHSSLEHGKDIVAYNPKGEVECFQLKDENINTNEMRKIYGEVEELIKIPVHLLGGALKSHKTSWLVTSGTISDPVIDKIKPLNRVNWGFSSNKKLFYKDRQVLTSEFVEHFSKFFPQETINLNRFLEIYISNGNSFFPTEKYVPFIESILQTGTETRSPSKRKILENIGAAIVITNYLLHPWILKNNSISQIQAWTLLKAQITHYLIKTQKLKLKDIVQSTLLIDDIIETNFQNLINEVHGRDHLIEGDWQTDSVVYGSRAAIVLGYVCSFGLYCQAKGKLDPELQKTILEICKKHISKIKFNGEAFVPSFIMITLFLELTSKHQESNNLIKVLVNALTNRKLNPSRYGFPNVYYSYEESIRILTLGFDNNQEENFEGQSYTLESLIEFLARRNEREFLTEAWRRITHTQYLSFKPTDQEDILLWRSDRGSNDASFPTQTQSWKVLNANAKKEIRMEQIIDFDISPEFLILFLMQFPHRTNKTTVGFIDQIIFPQLFNN